MRWVMLLIACFWLGTVHAVTAEHDSLKLRADALYQAGRFDTAYWVYEGLLKEGLEDGSLYFNMANTCMQLGKTADAVAWYEKALLRMPDDQKVLNNLRYALDKMEIDRKPEGWKWPVFLSTMLAIVAWWVGIFMLGWAYFNRRRTVKRLLLSAGIIFLLASAGMLTREFLFAAPREAIVLRDALVHAQPAELSGEVYELSAGTKVRVGETEHGWVQVIMTNGRKGWVRSFFLNFL